MILASLIGTSLEWYDFFLYTTAATLVFPQLFFPSLDPLNATLASLTTNAVAFVARPLGGIVFGHFGDRAGRKTVLVVTLLVMGASTFLIGVLPGYASVGVLAPVLLALLRFVQGLGLGGEWGGAVIMSLEHGDGRRRGFNASWPQVGVPAGYVLATGLLTVMSFTMSDAAFQSWGWRVPFLLSGLLVFVGLWVRLKVTESPMFAEVEERGAKARMPLVEVLRTHPRALLSAFTARIGVDVAFYTFTAFIIVYLTTVLELPRSYALNAVLIGSALQLVLIPLAGALSDRFGRRTVYLAGAISAAVWVFAFFPLLDSKSFPLIALAAVMALVTHAIMYGPQAAFIAELFSTRLRYSGASMGYQVAGIVGGSLAPVIALKLFDAYGSTLAVSIYVVGALAITALGLAIAPDTGDLDAAAAPPAKAPLPGQVGPFA
ncbi:MFS transporter [Nonomuraea phyllanthi]|uniref:Putative proline/betaine transporter n=1 Tax=Nonomuraea phyllanthi TaxID=2219224 RepID=A0A5C4WF09_9ACTN|nr:MFS transporter [Nonomuraea phyllanthi]QFY14683.1 MFS transporter [Nonomuraea phyllanthi]